jgi:hypothetical protein
MGGDCIAPDQGDILDEEAEDPLLFSVGRPGIVPKPGEVRGEA